MNESIVKVKEKLDMLNYGKCIDVKENDLELSQKDSYNSDSMEKVKSIYEELKKQLKSDYHVGVISAGTHTLDYANYYGFSNDMENWHEDPVMYVYECPANNSAWSFANESTINGNDKEHFICYNNKDYKKVDRDKKPVNEEAMYAYKKFLDPQDDSFEQHLCRCLWHVDYKKDYRTSIETQIGGNGEFNYFGVKEYGRFMVSLINEFKLANFYTTNMFRYEIFREYENVEVPLNLSNIAGDVFGIKKWKDVKPNSEYLTPIIHVNLSIRPKIQRILIKLNNDAFTHWMKSGIQ